MKKDIPFHKVEDVGVAVVPEKDSEGGEEWAVFLVNMGKEDLKGVIVSSTGYGTYQGRDVKTSTLRQFFESIPPEHAVKIELIETKLFGLNNEFWISFWRHGQMYDRKYVFVPESILPDNFTNIPLLNKRGVLIV